MTLKPQRNRYSPSQRLEYVQAWKASKMTLMAFAKQAGISEKTLYAWIRNYPLDKSALAPKPNTKPLTLLPTTTTTPSQTQKSSTTVPQNVEILLPCGIRVRFNTIENACQLTSFIKELKLCS